jgi:cholestenol delta-isomerase
MASAQDFLGQLWKEYALSDSRYVTSDTLVLCLETMTVVRAMIPTTQTRLSHSGRLTKLQFIWGPLCFFVAYLILNQHSLRHPLQLIVCMSHLYGDTLYYATSLYDHYVHGRSYCRPEAYYFWIYYFLMNFIWIVIPFCKFQNLGVEADTYSYMGQIIFLRVSRRSPMPSKLYSECLQPKRLGNVRDRHPSRRFSRNHRRTNGRPVGAYDYIWILI